MRICCTAIAWVSFAASNAAAAQLAAVWNVGVESGSVRALQAKSPWPFRKGELEVGLNSVLRYTNGQLFVVSRDQGTVTVVDTRRWRVRRMYELGTDSQLEDIAIINHRTAYLTRRTATHLLRLDLRTGDSTEVVDLSSLADADGIPDLGTMTAFEGTLFVQVRRFNEDAPGGFAPPAYLAVVDLASEQLIDVDLQTPGVQPIQLEGTAPKHRMQVLPAQRWLLVSATGGFFDEGGIEVIDLDTLHSAGLVIREADDMVGADLGPFVMVSPDRGYLVYSTDFDLSSHLQPFSLSGGVDPGPNLHVQVGYAVNSLEYDTRTDTFFVPNGVFGAYGVHVFDAATGERLTPTPIPTGGAPTDILLLRK